MSHHRVTAFSCLFLALSAAVSGCGSSAARTEHYVLEATRPAGPATTRSDKTLEVRRFSVDTAFSTRNLVCRLGEFRYEPDYYREFLYAPAQMLTDETRHWLASSGLFQQVLPPNSQVEPSYNLQANVTALYGDFIDRSAPVAVMRIRFFLNQSKEGEETTVFSQVYRAATPFSKKTGQALIRALSQDLTEILTQLEADLASFLSGKTD
ncbi:MAG: membrane integrity-associated transporter subunit PqiC [Sedimentisphaerales bacterium]|nr:membrane integrity-associated transporter subunit PqiC [Sedimentisphaerales bacterium]